jgi:RNA polymerase sigma-70 factor, ECF subfamily
LSSVPDEAGLLWAQFYLAHRAALTAYAVTLTGNAAAAADLVQDVLVRMVSERRPVANALAYFLKCLRNLALDRRRQMRRPAELPRDVAGFLDCDGAADRELADRVRTALQRLPDDYREVIVLKVYCGLTFRAVADLLGRPPSTVASNYRRGLAELKTLLAEVAEDVS